MNMRSHQEEHVANVLPWWPWRDPTDRSDAHNGRLILSVNSTGEIITWPLDMSTQIDPPFIAQSAEKGMRGMSR